MKSGQDKKGEEEQIGVNVKGLREDVGELEEGERRLEVRRRKRENTLEYR